MTSNRVLSDVMVSLAYIMVYFQVNAVQYHHWREGNLPANSKCLACKKTCWSSECLSGMRCEWCGVTVSMNFFDTVKPVI
jgi:diacylglycerol kinase (ATP)